MTDRELLELAAKAAGVERGKWDLKYLRQLGHCATQSMMWDPLTDDGDALRLAVGLGMLEEDSTAFNLLLKYLEIEDAANRYPSKSIPKQRKVSSVDRYAGRRRAIVRAAAEIGRAM